MQVVILAAGMGKRLKQKTQEHTKSMVPILGKTFLEHSLDKLTKFDISRIIIVIGYCGEEIKRVIGDSYNNVPVFYIENKIYKSTNNIYSLSLAKNYLCAEDTLLLESDLIYDVEIIQKLLQNPYPNLAVVDKYQSYMDGTVVKINQNDEIMEFVPKEHFDYKEVENYYKTVNIYKFSQSFLKNQYLPFLEVYCKTIGYNSYYEQVLKVLLSLEKKDLKVLRLEHEKWYEVDDLQDFDIAECLFCSNEDRMLRYEKRYGGYWRFADLKDFCYLVNPYFPSQQMIEEIKNKFENLLMNYPSGQKIQQNLMVNIFNLDEDMIAVGNGAAELISCLLSEINGRIGIILPTFQEYPMRVTKTSEVHYFLPKNSDFSYSVDDLKIFAQEIDTLILINPDNPSGNFIEKNDFLELVKFYKEHGKKIILDESFVDFSENLDDNSFLQKDILKEFPNLIVIKSISKSYGVPGLRLGLVASSDMLLVRKCRENLPIWNINSFAEFFLQILNKYKDAYRQACRKIADNRKIFFNQLAKIPFLRPIPSQANYILCEVLSPYRADKICMELLKSNIFVKNCQNKMGFDGSQYIRLAVKSQEENDFLICALEML